MQVTFRAEVEVKLPEVISVAVRFNGTDLAQSPKNITVLEFVLSPSEWQIADHHQADNILEGEIWPVQPQCVVFYISQSTFLWL